MSWFIAILRCVLCCEAREREDYRDYVSLNGYYGSSISSSSSYNYRDSTPFNSSSKDYSRRSVVKPSESFRGTEKHRSSVDPLIYDNFLVRNQMEPKSVKRELEWSKDVCQKQKSLASAPTLSVSQHRTEPETVKSALERSKEGSALTPSVSQRHSIDPWTCKSVDQKKNQSSSLISSLSENSYKRPGNEKSEASKALSSSKSTPPPVSFAPSTLPSISVRNSVEIKGSLWKENEPKLYQPSSPANHVRKSDANKPEAHRATLSDTKKSEVPKRPQSSMAPKKLSETIPTPIDSKPPPSSSEPASYSFKPILAQNPSDSRNPNSKTKSVWFQEGSMPTYFIPEDLKGLIMRDTVPKILKEPLSPLTYKNYFSALLYAEDYYCEKWSGFLLKNVTLELENAAIYRRPNRNENMIKNEKRDDKIVVTFEIDSVPEKRPFLLSRDLVHVRPAGKQVEPYQGNFYKVVRSTRILAEFGDDFHSRHSPKRKYDVSFSFNRVCLKRCHEALAAVTESLFRNILFPDQLSRTGIRYPSFLSHSHPQIKQSQISVIHKILMLNGPPPFLIEGPLSVADKMKPRSETADRKELTITGLIIREAVIQVYRTYPGCRILISAPANKTCDMLMRSLMEEIPVSNMFRANAAFREVDGVPCDIFPFCLYEGECFSCPTLYELQDFKVILSTFLSTFRLHNEGIRAGHFSHIFLVDASSATEPEAIVSLISMADERTNVIVTGADRNCSAWVRSDIARRHGLKISYFERLFHREPYLSLDPMFVAQLDKGSE